MNSVFAKTRAELAQLQLFTTGPAAKGVVVIARLLANEKDDFLLFFLGHFKSLGLLFDRCLLFVGYAAKAEGSRTGRCIAHS